MSWSIYQVSKSNTVVSFTQSQQEPNKVAVTLTEAMRNLVREGNTFEYTYTALKNMHDKYKEQKIRGIDSVKLSSHTSVLSSGEQGYKSIYLSYKLNGTFATFTEYLPLKNEL